tara:strand:+ start:46 stop:630 length:585 start_codon:yes stop_codon:yes gene_type:complete
MPEKKFIYKCKVDKENGAWNTDDVGQHIKDRKLCAGLISFFKKEDPDMIYDFGCGAGFYVKDFLKEDLSVQGYDANPNTPNFCDRCHVLDLSKPGNLEKVDWVLSLEVGEHLPPQYETTFIENLVNHSKKGIALSWAVKGQGGTGHFNEQDNQYVIDKIISYGYTYDEEKSNELRESCSLWWFRKTVMIFRKND